MASKKTTIATFIRLPSDLKTWIEREAKRNGASRNAEIIRALRARMDEKRHEIGGR